MKRHPGAKARRSPPRCRSSPPGKPGVSAPTRRAASIPRRAATDPGDPARPATGADHRHRGRTPPAGGSRARPQQARARGRQPRQQLRLGHCPARGWVDRQPARPGPAAHPQPPIPGARPTGAFPLLAAIVPEQARPGSPASSRAATSSPATALHRPAHPRLTALRAQLANLETEMADRVLGRRGAGHGPAPPEIAAAALLGLAN